ncbi:Beta-ketoacyl synthase, N-terminal domain and Beta-ketoacyl synthase, C-terminal domain and Thiolase-like, subgroup domain and Thiolase-like domain and Polyketide synthase, beta-ketoacyl synthase domain-containing protein [Strongyloides ratti]|uniref:beta-ketoacyl-[acyl-carrier-protein] synthase I n=1 Tax=Strongyloides ratti TaxID=34506 RepID=A0A090LA95_STRRB|nr:Beta-ketoacyl synthase, N-terminal domain and Beta-ketoacyl synthase, C-terminal domain and Thiolase-like, subgroup domain and Thiolase-like domain and Polyketide synthase, beta-ketoacyl synthase domain-containing protein [Strongyloides ratti]CEF65063.1 Beta-ketoacyl synthase, N-terminal domain and Beta-ketoacyl synthase, C-terminal domain and Thiolase-like, subgroup domain and Thiolase-like domain and Polyketide synthase, beta-ketoacyl synthase domain-containing protein [Strongyloides ratti]
MTHRVVITGLGAISPYGVGVETLWKGLQSMKSPFIFDDKLGIVCGRLSNKYDDQLKEAGKKYRHINRIGTFSLLAAGEAIKDAGLENENHHETGVNIGVGFTDLEKIVEVGKMIEEKKERRVSPYFIPNILTNIPSSYVAMEYNLLGGSQSCSAACATGITSIGDAFLSIKFGQTKRMLAGAIDSAINSLTKVGFQQLRALTRNKNPELASRPFDEKRDGFVLSEGGGLVVLERLEDALSRKAKIYGEILGYGISSDAHHLTSPREDGLGSLLSMQRCISSSNINPINISYVNAHATSTQIGDKVESASISNLLPTVMVSSYKGHLGHTLAGAGALEAIGTALSIKNKKIIGTLNLEKLDFATNNRMINNCHVWDDDNKKKISLINSFGFGGVYGTLCLSEYYDF